MAYSIADEKPYTLKCHLASTDPQLTKLRIGGKLDPETCVILGTYIPTIFDSDGLRKAICVQSMLSNHGFVWNDDHKDIVCDFLNLHSPINVSKKKHDEQFEKLLHKLLELLVMHKVGRDEAEFTEIEAIRKKN